MSALDAVRELGAKASKTPWHSLIDDGAPGDIFVNDAEWGLVFLPAPADAKTGATIQRARINAALTTLAVNNIEAAVAALDMVRDKCYCDHHPCSHEAVQTVLAAIERDAKEAQA